MSERDDAADGFLSRWARRKAQAREGVAAPEPLPVPRPIAEPAPPVEPQPPVATAAPEAVEARRPPPPSLDDVAQLDLTSDFRRFVAPDVTPEVKNAALKKLFTDPQFNLMDGLDTYIDDYGKPDPLPASMLRQMVQAKFLGLFDDEDKQATAAGAIPDGAEPAPEAQLLPEPLPPTADDQDAAVRLQPLDAAGPSSDPGGTGEDAGREC
jgi:hypothetical protein